MRITWGTYYVHISVFNNCLRQRKIFDVGETFNSKAVIGGDGGHSRLRNCFLCHSASLLPIDYSMTKFGVRPIPLIGILLDRWPIDARSRRTAIVYISFCCDGMVRGVVILYTERVLMETALARKKVYWFVGTHHRTKRLDAMFKYPAHKCHSLLP